MFEALANTVLVLHVCVVLFIVGGLLLIVVGNRVGWQWVNRLWFRLLHLAAIVYVAGQTWFGITCPLTLLENWLRSKSGSTQYAVGFVEYWFQRILFFDAPAWVFTLAYTAFALLVAASWWRFPPVHASQRLAGRDRKQPPNDAKKA